MEWAIAQTGAEYRKQSALWPTQDVREGARTSAERRPGNFAGR